MMSELVETKAKVCIKCGKKLRSDSSGDTCYQCKKGKSKIKYAAKPASDFESYFRAFIQEEVKQILKEMLS